ncbi:MAG: YidC/Oxa1 family membrane protein insertase [Anaerolineae bacterium]
MGQVWSIFFFQPMLNALLLLYDFLGQNFALSIVVFTILVRIITLPLTLPQQKSAKKMQELQPLLKQLQEKYGKEKEKLAQEQMKLYKEHGINPMGGCLPMLIQFPIWIGLYQAISQSLSNSPLMLLELSKNVYPAFPQLSRLFPLQDRFLWMNLAYPDPTYILPILVAVTTYLQQIMLTPPTGGDSSDSASSMGKMMQYYMPLMLGFFSLQFPSGLSLYWVISSVVGIAIQYVMNNWESLLKGEFSFQGFTLPRLLADAGVESGRAPRLIIEETAPEEPDVKGKQDEPRRRRKKKKSKRRS